jgi:peptidoglycan/xylan/chitin deacetylase (PgdA/CDA1 family)
MYHDVLTADGRASGRPGAAAAHYKLSWEQFLEHLDCIGEVAAAPPTVIDDESAGTPGSRSWTLTFDDGGASALDVGAELERRGWRAYFFITTGRIGSNGFVDADATRAIDRMGHVVGSHSVTHPHRIAALTLDDLLYEWRASVETLAELLGKEIRAASVPGGYYGRHVAVAAAGAGIGTLFTSEPVTRAQRVDGCLVIGRYVIRDTTSARVAAQAAAGSRVPWIRQYVAWNVSKPVKARAGERYDRLRGALAARSGPSAPR